jgi:hypothetical protein
LISHKVEDRNTGTDACMYVDSYARNEKRVGDNDQEQRYKHDEQGHFDGRLTGYSVHHLTTTLSWCSSLSILMPRRSPVLEGAPSGSGYDTWGYTIADADAGEIAVEEMRMLEIPDGSGVLMLMLMLMLVRKRVDRGGLVSVN